MRLDTNAKSERVLGQYGTVEEAYKPKAGKRYTKGSKPKTLEPTSICGSIPTQEQRTKLARIEREQARHNRSPKPRKTNVRSVKFVGRTGDDKYGIEVKMSGIKATTYWLPFSQADKLWHELSGTNLQNYIGD